MSCTTAEHLKFKFRVHSREDVEHCTNCIFGWNLSTGSEASPTGSPTTEEVRDVSGHLAGPRQWFISCAHARSRCCGVWRYRKSVSAASLLTFGLVSRLIWCERDSDAILSRLPLRDEEEEDRSSERSCHLWYFNGFTGVWNCLKAS